MFTHLHLHTQYSLLDGACRINQLIDSVKSKGMNSCAITDHGVMYGAVEFYNSAISKGIKPIIGCEVYVANRTRFDKTHEFDAQSSHLVLLCENNTGYKNLCKIVSKAFTDGFYYKPRVDRELLEKYHEGIIALSACLQGELCRFLVANRYDEALDTAKWYANTFGKDNYFIEVQDHGIVEQKLTNPKLIKIANEIGVGIVATNDTHYIEKNDFEMQKCLLLVGTNKTVEDDDTLEFQSNEFYLKDENEMLLNFPKEYIDNTQKIADRCNVTFEFGNLKLPNFEIENYNGTHYDYFEKQCYDGLKKHFINPTKEYLDRLKYELEIINKMGYVDYYLIVADFVNYAKSVDIPVGPGRGSGAASLCAYCIGITDIDPIKYNLLFERFLNPERVSMPDFDIDFCYIRRQEVIDYVVRRYSSDHVAQIVTFGTLAAKQAIRDIGRALAIPYSTVDNVAKLIPNDIHQTIDNALKESEKLSELYNSDFNIKKLVDLAKKVEGMPRHASTHAAGVVITDKPVSDYVPLALNDEAVVTQFTMTELERIGLLKMDFLGLRNLTVIDDCQKMIRETEPNFDITKVNDNDEKTFKMLSAGLSEGVFQFESAGMKRTMMSLKPTSIEDLIALLSLYRPGPMKSIPKFIEGKNNHSKIKYASPLLEPILNVTYGCMVYQEQVMQVFRTLAGYSFGNADIVRRAMAKKKHDVLMQEKPRFVEGCHKNSISTDIANSLFDEISAFSSYAFNKAHAAAYSVVSYRTAYLKCHYPTQYFSALLTSVLDRQSKVQSYIVECSKLGIKVLMPHINKSQYNFSVDENNIRYGLLGIKNVGRTLVDNLIIERNKNGEYKDIYDFCKRNFSRELNRRAIESLIKAGAMDGLNYNRREMIEAIDDIIFQISTDKSQNIDGQIALFANTNENLDDFNIKHFEEFDSKTLLLFEREVIGFYLSSHPLEQYKNLIANNHLNKIGTIINDDEFCDGKQVKILSFVDKIKLKTTKKNEQMAFVNIEDDTGTIETLVFPRPYSNYNSLISKEKPLIISGKISEKDDSKQIIVDKIEYIDNYSSNMKKLYISVDDIKSSSCKNAVSIIKKNVGSVAVIIYSRSNKKIYKSDSLKCNLTNQLFDSLADILGNDFVKIK